MMIELKGVQFVNKGAELMLFSILAQVNQLWPEAEICMELNPNVSAGDLGKINAYKKLVLIKNRFDFNGFSYWLPSFVRQYLKQKFRIVTEADVDLILDGSGFAYSEQWRYLPLKQISGVATRFHHKKKPYILLPQAFGPFNQANYQKAAKTLFDYASLTFVRDPVSLDYVTQCSHSKNIALAPDFTNLLVAKVPLEYQKYAGQVAIIPNNKMLTDGDSLWQKHYLDLLTKVIEYCQENGQRVFLLNHEGKGDKALCEQINQQLTTSVDILDPECALAIKAIIGQCAWVVSSRFHGCVSALSQNVPCLATSWSHKYQQLFNDYQHSEWLLNAEQSPENLAKLLHLFSNKKAENADALKTIAAEIKSQAREVWQKVAECVN